MKKNNTHYVLFFVFFSVDSASSVEERHNKRLESAELLTVAFCVWKEWLTDKLGKMNQDLNYVNGWWKNLVVRK